MRKFKRIHYVLAPDKEMYLRSTDLRYAILDHMKFNKYNFSGLDFTNSYLKSSILRNVNLERCCLKHADLRFCNFNKSNLTNVNLVDADIRFCEGNGVEIKNLQSELYKLVYTKEVLAIGCQQHKIIEWQNFSDEEIYLMDGACGRDWWKENKRTILREIK